MFIQNQKTELMIVCDEKLMEYGNYLIALVGQNDDKENQVVGTKDGTVAAAIYTPKHYKDTLPKITSNTHILFIGRFKEATEQAKNINMNYNEFGMHYGWLGKRAVMYVDDKKLNQSEYESFLEYCEKYKKDFEKVTLSIIDKLPDAAKWIGVFNPVLAPVAIYGLVSGNNTQKKIKDQQYRCLTMALYLDGLQQFLEG